MTPQEVAKLKLLIIGTSKYYGQQVQDDVLALYVEDLEDLPFELVVQAFKDVRRDPKTTRFPLPALIRDRIAPANTDENDAQAAVNRVIEAVSRFGWSNPDRAEAFIGELGWRVVRSDGGWRQVCEALTSENLNTSRAQWRTLALALIRRSRMGTLDTAPALPGKTTEALRALPLVLKTIPGSEL